MLASRSPFGQSIRGREYVRRGLLWALLGGVIYYFAGGHSPLTIPFAVPGFINMYLVPALFLAGIGMALYGGYLQMRN